MGLATSGLRALNMRGIQEKSNLSMTLHTSIQPLTKAIFYRIIFVLDTG